MQQIYILVVKFLTLFEKEYTFWVNFGSENMNGKQARA